MMTVTATVTAPTHAQACVQRLPQLLVKHPLIGADALHMALLRPALDHLTLVTPALDGAERATAQALAGLDAAWTVFVRPRVGLDVASFIAVHPQAGVCTVQVLDWQPQSHRVNSEGMVEEPAASGSWKRSATQPLAEAARRRANIFDQFFALPSDGTETTQAVRAAVILPMMSDAEARQLLVTPAASDREREVDVFGADALRSDPEAIVAGHGCALPAHASMHRLVTHLAVVGDAAAARPAAARSAGVADIEMNPDGHPFRRIRGAAGSGKSFGVAARAAHLASEGKQVLVLSFNITLANRLGQLVRERCAENGADPSLVTCANFHSFCTRVVQDAEALGVETFSPRSARWTQAIVTKAIQAYESHFECRYDAILVDEGQDFTQPWWDLLRDHALAPDGEMLLAVDPTQDLYERHSWVNDDDMLAAGFTEPWVELTDCYRLPPDLQEITNEFAVTHLEGAHVVGRTPADLDVVVDADGAGSIRRWRTVDQVGKIGIEVGREVVRLLRDNPQLSPSDVAFVCEYHHDGVAAARVIESAGHHVHHIFSRDPDDARRRRKYRFAPDAAGVKGATVHSLKGWDIPAVVVGIGMEAKSKRMAYVAMTRTLLRSGGPSFVSVVNADSRIASFGKTFESGPMHTGTFSARAAVAPPVGPAPAAAVAPLTASAVQGGHRSVQLLAPPCLAPPNMTPPAAASMSPAALLPPCFAPPPPPEPVADPVGAPTTWSAPAAAERRG